jgi:fumarate reductase flavoprotein subunit
MLRCLEGRLRGAGGQLRRGVTVKELIVRGGRCSGVIAEEQGRMIRLESAATVIADGGFQANLELLARYVSPAPRALVMRHAGTGRGAGLLMALAAGAETTALGGFYGHVQCAEARTNPKLWPYPTCDHLVGAGVAVDETGARFADEGRGGVYIANRIAALSAPTRAFAVFDNRAWRERATAFPLPANPLLIKAGATMHRADDIAGLARAAGLPAERLQHTVTAYNAALAAGAAGKLTPPRSATVFAPLPVVVAPFYAVSILAGITYTTGGIAIDERCRVRAGGGGTIAGLYAAGSTTGGHEGGAAAGYTGGLSKALVFGRRAGDTLADDLAQRARLAS